MSKPTRDLIDTLPQIFKTVLEQPFNYDGTFKQLTTLQQVILKFYLNATYGDGYEEYQDLYTGKQVLNRLQAKHLNTDLGDLKSLDTIYPLIKNNPMGLFKKDNHQYQILTYQQVIDELKHRLNKFNADDNRDDIEPFTDYLLTTPLNQAMNNQYRHSITEIVLYSVFADKYFNQFSDYDDIDTHWQNEIHGIATSCDYDISDPDDSFDMGPEFMGYDQNTLDELQTCLNEYQKFIKTANHNYLYDENAKPITIQTWVNWFAEFPLD